MAVRDEVSDALAGLRQGLQADGADLVVDSVDEGVATVRLTFGSEACMDCIVPGGILNSLIASAFRETNPDLQVRLLDPREVDGGG